MFGGSGSSGRSDGRDVKAERAKALAAEATEAARANARIAFAPLDLHHRVAASAWVETQALVFAAPFVRGARRGGGGIERDRKRSTGGSPERFFSSRDARARAGVAEAWAGALRAMEARSVGRRARKSRAAPPPASLASSAVDAALDAAGEAAGGDSPAAESNANRCTLYVVREGALKRLDEGGKKAVAARLAARALRSAAEEEGGGSANASSSKGLAVTLLALASAADAAGRVDDETRDAIVGAVAAGSRARPREAAFALAAVARAAPESAAGLVRGAVETLRDASRSSSETAAAAATVAALIAAAEGLELGLPARDLDDAADAALALARRETENAARASGGGARGGGSAETSLASSSLALETAWEATAAATELRRRSRGTAREGISTSTSTSTSKRGSPSPSPSPSPSEDRIGTVAWFDAVSDAAVGALDAKQTSDRVAAAAAAALGPLANLPQGERALVAALRRGFLTNPSNDSDSPAARRTVRLRALEALASAPDAAFARVLETLEKEKAETDASSSGPLALAAAAAEPETFFDADEGGSLDLDLAEREWSLASASRALRAALDVEDAALGPWPAAATAGARAPSAPSSPEEDDDASDDLKVFFRRRLRPTRRPASSPRERRAARGSPRRTRAWVARSSTRSSPRRGCSCSRRPKRRRRGRTGDARLFSSAAAAAAAAAEAPEKTRTVPKKPSRFARRPPFAALPVGSSRRARRRPASPRPRWPSPRSSTRRARARARAAFSPPGWVAESPANRAFCAARLGELAGLLAAAPGQGPALWRAAARLEAHARGIEWGSDSGGRGADVAAAVLERAEAIGSFPATFAEAARVETEASRSARSGAGEKERDRPGEAAVSPDGSSLNTYVLPPEVSLGGRQRAAMATAYLFRRAGALAASDAIRPVAARLVAAASEVDAGDDDAFLVALEKSAGPQSADPVSAAAASSILETSWLAPTHLWSLRALTSVAETAGSAFLPKRATHAVRVAFALMNAPDADARGDASPATSAALRAACAALVNAAVVAVGPELDPRGATSRGAPPSSTPPGPRATKDRSSRRGRPGAASSNVASPRRQFARLGAADDHHSAACRAEAAVFLQRLAAFAPRAMPPARLVPRLGPYLSESGFGGFGARDVAAAATRHLCERDAGAVAVVSDGALERHLFTFLDDRVRARARRGTSGGTGGGVGTGGVRRLDRELDRPASDAIRAVALLARRVAADRPATTMRRLAAVALGEEAPMIQDEREREGPGARDADADAGRRTRDVERERSRGDDDDDEFDDDAFERRERAGRDDDAGVAGPSEIASGGAAARLNDAFRLETRYLAACFAASAPLHASADPAHGDLGLARRAPGNAWFALHAAAAVDVGYRMCVGPHAGLRPAGLRALTNTLRRIGASADPDAEEEEEEEEKSEGGETGGEAPRRTRKPLALAAQFQAQIASALRAAADASSPPRCLAESAALATAALESRVAARDPGAAEAIVRRIFAPVVETWGPGAAEPELRGFRRRVGFGFGFGGPLPRVRPGLLGDRPRCAEGIAARLRVAALAARARARGGRGRGRGEGGAAGARPVVAVPAWAALLRDFARAALETDEASRALPRTPGSAANEEKEEEEEEEAFLRDLRDVVAAVDEAEDGAEAEAAETETETAAETAPTAPSPTAPAPTAPVSGSGTPSPRSSPAWRRRRRVGSRRRSATSPPPPPPTLEAPSPPPSPTPAPPAPPALPRSRRRFRSARCARTRRSRSRARVASAVPSVP